MPPASGGEPLQTPANVTLEHNLSDDGLPVFGGVDAAGWLAGVERVCSPNFDARPDSADISLLVIHNISLPPGEFGTGCVSEFFTNTLDHSRHPFFNEIEGVRVSAHFLIERSGRVIQFVATDKRAWHAGVSCFDSREACNDFAIGIELEGTDSEPYTPLQYRALQALTEALMAHYPSITPQRIVGHSDIAPGRKTDPGPFFDWPYYIGLIESC